MRKYSSGKYTGIDITPRLTSSDVDVLKASKLIKLYLFIMGILSKINPCPLSSMSNLANLRNNYPSITKLRP